jgi:hypothetical protein
MGSAVYVLTVTNFADMCTGHERTVSFYDSYEDARAAAGRTASVDDLTVDTRRMLDAGADVVAASGVFVDRDGVPLYGFRITRES